jgi:DNA-binding transcriptional ArsR family regulator
MSDAEQATAVARDAELFRVLGHETRLRLLALLAAGELAVSEIDAASGIGQPGLSQQLAILRKARLVTPRRAAKQVYYRVDPAVLEQAAALLRQLARTAAKGAAAPADPIARPRKRAAGSSASFARML